MPSFVTKPHDVSAKEVERLQAWGTVGSEAGWLLKMPQNDKNQQAEDKIQYLFDHCDVRSKENKRMPIVQHQQYNNGFHSFACLVGYRY